MTKKSSTLTREQVALLRKLRTAIGKEAVRMDRLRELELELKELVSYVELLEFHFKYGRDRYAEVAKREAYYRQP